MKTTFKTSTDTWNAVLDVLRNHSSGEVHDIDLTAPENDALDHLADLVDYHYNHQFPKFECALNNALARQTLLDSTGNRVQISIPYNQFAADLVDTHASGRRWEHRWQIVNGALYCKSNFIRIHVRTEEVARLLHVEEDEAAELKKTFGTVYHGRLLMCDAPFEVANTAKISVSISSIVDTLQQQSIDAITDTWIQDYFSQSFWALAVIRTTNNSYKNS